MKGNSLECSVRNEFTHRSKEEKQRSLCGDGSPPLTSVVLCKFRERLTHNKIMNESIRKWNKHHFTLCAYISLNLP